MQTFKQFLEAREVKDISKDNIRYILSDINDPILCVKFALYSAEDYFQFHNETTRGPVRRCIDLIKKWLRNPKSVTYQELSFAADAINTAIDATADANHATAVSTNTSILSAINAAWAAYYAGNTAYYAAAYAAYAAYVNAANAANNASYAAESAANAAAYIAGHLFNTTEWRRMYWQKLQEYTRKLKGMTTTRSGHSTSIEPLKGYDNTHFSIMAALDYLEEIGEIGKEHFVYQDGNDWVFDLGHDNILRADSREALARLIHNDKYYLNALLRLYNANV